jgi:ATP adenylyltransferase
MEWPNLWAPWRLGYIKSVPAEGVKSQCFLCEAWAHTEDDPSRLVLHRAADAMIILNRFPYTTGHVMIAPAEHRGTLADFSAATRASMMELCAIGQKLVQAVFNPQGLNVGINIGRCAGAGVPDHMHIHIVPRWGGDTNFMHVVGQVRVIPQALEETYAELAAALPKVLREHGA